MKIALKKEQNNEIQYEKSEISQLITNLSRKVKIHEKEVLKTKDEPFEKMNSKIRLFC